MSTLSLLSEIQLSLAQISLIVSICATVISLFAAIVPIILSLRNRLHFEIFSRQVSWQFIELTISNKSKFPFSICGIHVIYEGTYYPLEVAGKDEYDTPAYVPYKDVRIDGDDTKSKYVRIPVTKPFQLTEKTKFKIITNRRTLKKKPKIIYPEKQPK